MPHLFPLWVLSQHRVADGKQLPKQALGKVGLAPQVLELICVEEGAARRIKGLDRVILDPRNTTARKFHYIARERARFVAAKSEASDNKK